MNKPSFLTLNAKTPRCPLCGTFMERHFDPHRRTLVILCRRDKVGIRQDDPMLGRWEEALSRLTPEELEGMRCPIHLGAPPRFFCTSTGYMRAICSKKGCVFKAEILEPDRTEYEGEGTKGLIAEGSA